MLLSARSLFKGWSPRAAGRALAFVALVVALSAPARAVTMQTGAPGVVQGRVEIQPAPPRRRAQRYPSGRAQAARAVQELAAVVYLRSAPGVTEPPGSLGSPGSPGYSVTVSQQDTAFVPAILVVPPGATVDFTNEDPFFHNVFSYSQAMRFDLGRYPAGQSKSVAFEESGIVKVYCEVHEFMRAVVLVWDSPYHSPVSEDGSFTIRGVPPGTYDVVAWHADFDEQVTPVTIMGGETATVQVTLR